MAPRSRRPTRYAGDRVNSTSRGDATTDYQYDDFGAVKEIKVEAGQGTQQPTEDTSSFTYDEFERMTNASGPGLDSEATYTYDGLDRRDSRCEGGEGGGETCTGGESHDYSYVGSSELLSQEEGSGQSSAYDYDSLGDSLGQTNQPSADDPATYRSYAKDANGSVEGLEDGSGEFGTDAQGRSDRYEYDPYGQLENEDNLSEVAKANPLRFEGFYYDEGLKAYDMQARPYRPDVGRFLTQDRFESARGDFNLVSDPLTGNRYAFAGGNPVSRVEWDGHRSDACQGNGYAVNGGKDRARRGGGGGGGSTAGGTYYPPSRGGIPALVPHGNRPSAFQGPVVPLVPCADCTPLLTEQGRQIGDAQLGLFVGIAIDALAGGGQGLQRYSSEQGKLLRESPSSKERSNAARRLPGAGKLGEVGGRASRVLGALSGTVSYLQNRAEGRSITESGARAGITAAASAAGAAAGGAACATVATTGFGAAACPVLVGGGAALGGLVGDRYAGAILSKAHYLFGPVGPHIPAWRAGHLTPAEDTALNVAPPSR